MTLLDTTGRSGGATIVTDADGVHLLYDPSQSMTLQQLRKGDSLVEELRFRVDDGRGGSTSATVRITVQGRNDWHNPTRPLGVNADATIDPLDALLIINTLNELGGRVLPGVIGAPPFFYDTNDDGSVTSLDALIVIGHLNSGSGEGEAVAPLVVEMQATAPAEFPVERTPVTVASSRFVPPAQTAARVAVSETQPRAEDSQPPTTVFKPAPRDEIWENDSDWLLADEFAGFE